MGRKQTAADALEWAVQKGFNIVGVMTDSHLSVSPTSEVARKYNLPLYTYEMAEFSIKNGELKFDFGVSLVYWRILKEPFLSHAEYRIINFHPAPLPEYKGTAGYNMAIMEELDKWAVTAHYIDSGIDTGDIVDAFEFSIDHEEETAFSLEKTSQNFLLSLFKKVMKDVNKKGVLPSKPNVGGRHISRSEMETMKAVVPTDDIDKKIRAFWFPPYTGAYVEFNDKKYTLVNSEILATLAESTASNLFRVGKQN